jgi:hypothetical protein
MHMTRLKITAGPGGNHSEYLVLNIKRTFVYLQWVGVATVQNLESKW